MNSLSHIYGVRLTQREKEIQGLINEGLSSRQIANKLDISEFTVANHRKSILKKKGLKSLKNMDANTDASAGHAIATGER